MSEPMRTPDWHPEDYCHRCGGRNASWHVDSDRFNAAMGPPTLHRWNGIICPGCFVELHEAATGLTATWTLSPDTPFRHIDPEPDVSVDNPQTDRACGPHCGCNDPEEQL